MKRLIVFTCRAYPHLEQSDQLIARLLNASGIEVVPQVWNQPMASEFVQSSDALVRSIWDYHLLYEDYCKWLDVLEGMNLQVYNPIPMLRWNAHKSYLTALAEKGIPVIPTTFLKTPHIEQVLQAMAGLDGNQKVIKPAVGASAHQTYLVNSTDQALEIDFDLFKYGCLIQPFMTSLPVDGEWSMIFFNGVYSHAVLKRARSQEYRVQSEYGGTLTFQEPQDQHIMHAERIVHTLDGGIPLYARVDGIVIDGVFVLSEIELIEPQLFLHSSELRQRFTEAIVQRLLE